MASNVFGNPITDALLKGMPEYNEKTIKSEDRARVALDMKNAEAKDVAARDFVVTLQERYLKTCGDDTISAMCLVYNATGDTLTLKYSKDYMGHLGESSYPMVLRNGQWGAFFHVQSRANKVKESRGTVMYKSEQRDAFWLLAWRASLEDSTNLVLTQTGNNSVLEGETWADIDKCLVNCTTVTHVAEANGCLAYGSIGNSALPFCEGIMTLKAAL